VTLVLAITGASHNSSWSVSGYVVSVLLISFPWTIAIFRRYYISNID
jgi:hypothetical protein